MRSSRRAAKDVNVLAAMSKEAMSEHCDQVRSERDVPMLLLFVVMGKVQLNQTSGITKEVSLEIDRSFDQMVKEDDGASTRSLMRNELAEAQLRESRSRTALRSSINRQASHQAF